MVTTGSARARTLGPGGFEVPFDIQMTVLKNDLTKLQRRIAQGLPAALKTERRWVPVSESELEPEAEPEDLLEFVRSARDAEEDIPY
jgi:hypothetical protein